MCFLCFKNRLIYKVETEKPRIDWLVCIFCRWTLIDIFGKYKEKEKNQREKKEKEIAEEHLFRELIIGETIIEKELTTIINGLKEAKRFKENSPTA